LEDYDAIMAVGGDGSFHEVINGMLKRSDHTKLPIGLIPNGTGNDLCGSLGINSLQ
jgi:diacylglycerol kinase family enzyme